MLHSPIPLPAPCYGQGHYQWLGNSPPLSCPLDPPRWLLPCAEGSSWLGPAALWLAASTQILGIDLETWAAGEGGLGACGAQVEGRC